MYVLAFCSYTFHNKYQEHHEQWSSPPWHGGSCSSLFRRPRVIVSEKQSIARSVEGCSGNFFLVLSLPWMQEPFSHQQDFISFNSCASWSPSQLPGIHHRSCRSYRSLAGLEEIGDAFQRGHCCSGWMRWNRITRKGTPLIAFQHGQFILHPNQLCMAMALTLRRSSLERGRSGRFVLCVNPSMRMCILQ